MFLKKINGPGNRAFLFCDVWLICHTSKLSYDTGKGKFSSHKTYTLFTAA